MALLVSFASNVGLTFNSRPSKNASIAGDGLARAQTATMAALKSAADDSASFCS